MNFIFQAFSFYDALIGSFPPSVQFFVALFLLILLIWSFLSIFTHGHWIFVVIFIILFPSSWPALKTVGGIIWAILKFLFVRVQVNS